MCTSGSLDSGQKGFPRQRVLTTSIHQALMGPGVSRIKKAAASEEAGWGEGWGECPALQPEVLLPPRVRAINLMASSGLKLWLRYPSFLLISPDLLPPRLGKRPRKPRVELSEAKAYSENALYHQSGGFAGICL